MIKDDDWTLVIALSKQSVKDLTDASSVQVRFPKDNETMTAAFSMKKSKAPGLDIWHLIILWFVMPRIVL